MITSPTSPELSTPQTLAEFVARFETGEIDIAVWTHAAHVAVGGALAQQSGPDEAITRMRNGIHRLLAHNSVETTLLRGYHESVTRLWIYACNAFLAECGQQGAEAIRSVVAFYAGRGTLHREYWSYDVLTSEAARYGWQPPDLKPIPAAWRSGDRWISCNPRFLNVAKIHAFLAGTYWSPEIPRPVVERAIRGSLPFGVYVGDELVGFARVVTDYATYGYVADVFIAESHRGKGLSVWLMDCVLKHPSLQGFRRWQLATRDAHDLYRRFGFTEPANPSGQMEILNRDAYRKT